MADIYSACVIQSEHTFVTDKKEIRKNIDRYADLLEGRFGEGSSAPWAPTKLIALPEGAINGTEFPITLESGLKIAIEAPGEETEYLSELARKFRVFIAGQMYEVDTEWPDRYFDSGFLIDPKGNFVLKYRKYQTCQIESANSSHAMFNEYIKRYGDDLNTFFPVAKTEIGNIGVFLCLDGHFPEVTRALVTNGAEVLVHCSCYPESLVNPPGDVWEAENRVRAHENIAYVVAPNAGLVHSKYSPKMLCPGKSMIVDFNGAIIAKADYVGESLISAPINLDVLRQRRRDPDHNYPQLLRTEAYRYVYDRPNYPKDTFRSRGVDAAEDRTPEKVMLQ